MRLAYCTNVAPAETFGTLVAGLGGLWSDVRRLADPGGAGDQVRGGDHLASFLTKGGRPRLPFFHGLHPFRLRE